MPLITEIYNTPVMHFILLQVVLSFSVVEGHPSAELTGLLQLRLRFLTPFPQLTEHFDQSDQAVQPSF